MAAVNRDLFQGVATLQRGFVSAKCLAASYVTFVTLLCIVPAGGVWYLEGSIHIEKSSPIADFALAQTGVSNAIGEPACDLRAFHPGLRAGS